MLGGLTPMSKARLHAPLLGAVVAALTAGALILGGAGAADAKDSQARTAKDQEQLLDPQAPLGTEAKSAKAATADTPVDSPVQTTATDPDTKSDLQKVASTDGGRWTKLPTLPSGSNAYHLIMGPKGKILLLAGSGNSSDVFEAGTFKSYVWEPETGALEEKTTPKDMFCSGHMLMSNGQAIAAGGTAGYKTSTSPWKGSKALYTFDFETETFKKQENMFDGRWYPSVINTRGGYALIVGGFDAGGKNSATSEVYVPWTEKYDPRPGNREFPLYPHIFLTSKAKYFFTGEGWTKPDEDGPNSSSYFHPGFWAPFNGNKYQKVNDLTKPTQRGFGTSCWLGSIRRQKIMVMGGGWPATSTTNVIDLDSSSTPKFKSGPSLRAAKAYVSCVNLPDGSVLELGGGSANKIANASQTVSLLKSATATSWTAMNPLPTGEHRLYHSMAYLADDGSVISLSSNPKGQARSNTVLRFEPPYMFKGDRPTLSDVPEAITYGQTYSINASSDVTRVVMMSAPSPTHGFDANQRQIPLQYADGKITINATSSLAPRGYYRLFVINDKGAVSTAKWTKLN
jgi:Galactose oxidase-like, Early set domain